MGSTRIPSSPLKHSLEQPSAQKKKRLSSTGAVLCRSAEAGTLQRVQVIDFRGLVLALEVTLFSTVLDRIFLCFYTCDSASPVESCSGATRVADGHGMRPCLSVHSLCWAARVRCSLSSAMLVDVKLLAHPCAAGTQ